jgi:hypothetical protein
MRNYVAIHYSPTLGVLVPKLNRVVRRAQDTLHEIIQTMNPMVLIQMWSMLFPHAKVVSFVDDLTPLPLSP